VLVMVQKVYLIRRNSGSILNVFYKNLNILNTNVNEVDD